MIIDDTGHMAFVYDAVEGTLSFEDRGEDGKRITLMWIRLEQEKLPHLSVWLGERQHLWADWRRLAERKGAQALAQRLTKLFTKRTWEQCIAALLIVQRKNDPEVEIAAGMATRKVEILRHRFETLAHRDAFLSWIDQGDEAEKSQALSIVGLLQGRPMLAMVLDGIADFHLEEAPTSGKLRH